MTGPIKIFHWWFLILLKQVMVQGVSVSQDNVNHVIQYVHDHLIAFENALSVSFIKLLENMSARVRIYIYD